MHALAICSTTGNWPQGCTDKTGENMFSVIIPAYNAEHCIERCINSILNQSFGEFEIIVVNDGSTDATLERLSKFSDKRIRVFTQENAGVSAARNKGIENAGEPYICFLDSDDEWFENHLSDLKEAISKFPDKLFFVTFNMAEMLDGSVVKQFDYNGSDEPFFVDDFLQYEFKNGIRKCFFTGTVCTHKTAFEKYGVFSVGSNISEDEDMWNRIMLFEGKVIVPKASVLRHRDYSNLTSKLPVGAPCIFNSRIAGYLADDRLSSAKKEELKRLYNIMELVSIRSYIVHGMKHKAAKMLKNIDRKYVPKKKYIETLAAFFIPSFMLKKYVLDKNRNYFK